MFIFNFGTEEFDKDRVEALYEITGWDDPPGYNTMDLLRDAEVPEQFYHRLSNRETIEEVDIGVKDVSTSSCVCVKSREG